ncbi:DMT family transporter [Pleomorphomonas oryzae]|uniref:DMT family transporter n=1 Tax=Pleomorphomonas oryzae TaxID=261934 RepID=UPI00042082ED|nr:DMT family transporter [Pleomorphomonas oryzae]
MPWFILAALSAGAMLPLQALFNARLGRSVGSMFYAAGFSAALSALLLVLAGFFAMGGSPRTGDLSAVPAWAWAGGVCGLVTLAGITFAAPRLGAGSTVALVVTGQVIFSLVLDHFGLFGLAPQAVTLQRALAAALLLSGAFLIR